MLQTEGGYNTCAQKRMKLAEHLRYLPMGYYNENSLGRIMSVTTNTMQSLENVATRVVMIVCSGLLATAVITLMILVFDWRIGLILLVGLVVFFIINTGLMKASAGMAKQKQVKDSALAADKKLLVFDKPTSGLDFAGMQCTAELIRSLGTDVTVLIVTHDMELIQRCCTHVLHIENGSI